MALHVPPPALSLTSGFQSKMNRRAVLSSLLLLPPLAFVACRSIATVAEARPYVELSIATDGDLLAFRPTELTCPTGAKVRLTMHHTGKYINQDHDWVLTLPGTSDSVAEAGERAGERAGYVPLHDRRVIAATRLCGKGGTASVIFIAPRPGDYPFFCSYPGHNAFMHGVLHVLSV